MADITRISTSLSDAYNAVGYWSSFSVRGYRLDERQNYRRDGLPINAETALWLGNKSSLEVLRGTSGMQAGVSAPGGLVNLLVKRPNGTRRVATLGFEERGTLPARARHRRPRRARRRDRLAHQRRTRSSSIRCCARRAASARAWPARSSGGSAPTRGSKPRSS